MRFGTVALICAASVCALQNKPAAQTTASFNHTSASVEKAAMKPPPVVELEKATIVVKPETAEKVKEVKPEPAQIVLAAEVAEAPVVEKTATDEKPAEKAPVSILAQQDDTGLINEIMEEQKTSSWPMWVVISLWAIGVPAMAMLGLMLFAGLAIVFNSWWQKNSHVAPPSKKPSDPFKNVKKRMLPEGWAVHLNEEGNIYYVNKLTGLSTWEFPEEESTSPKPLMT